MEKALRSCQASVSQDKYEGLKKWWMTRVTHLISIYVCARSLMNNSKLALQWNLLWNRLISGELILQKPNWAMEHLTLDIWHHGSKEASKIWTPSGIKEVDQHLARLTSETCKKKIDAPATKSLSETFNTDMNAESCWFNKIADVLRTSIGHIVFQQTVKSKHWPNQCCTSSIRFSCTGAFLIPNPIRHGERWCYITFTSWVSLLLFLNQQS